MDIKYIMSSSVLNSIERYNEMLNRIRPGRKKLYDTICSDLKTIIGGLTPEDVRECKRGRWFVEKKDTIYGGRICRITCSVCGNSFNISADDLPDEDFCRRCGAYNKEKEYV